MCMLNYIHENIFSNYAVVHMSTHEYTCYILLFKIDKNHTKTQDNYLLLVANQYRDYSGLS